MIDPTTLDVSKLPWLPIHVCEAFPKSPAIYFAIDDNNLIWYVGRTIDSCRRFQSHHKINEMGLCGVSKIAFLFFNDSIVLPEVEAILIKYFKPNLNLSIPVEERSTAHRKIYYKPRQIQIKYNEAFTGGFSQGLKIRKVDVTELTQKGLGAAIHEAQQKNKRPVSMVVIELGISTTYWRSIIYERVESISYNLLKKIEMVLNWDSGITL